MTEVEAKPTENMKDSAVEGKEDGKSLQAQLVNPEKSELNSSMTDIKDSTYTSPRESAKEDKDLKELF